MLNIRSIQRIYVGLTLVLFCVTGFGAVELRAQQTGQLLTEDLLFTRLPDDQVYMSYARFLGEPNWQATVFGQGYSSIRKEQYFYYVEDRNGTWLPREISGTSEDMFLLNVLDFDRDGYDDIIAGRFALHRSLGASGTVAFARPRLILDAGISTRNLAFCDINNDGFEDLIYIDNYWDPETNHRDESVWVAINNRGRSLIAQNQPVHVGPEKILWIGDLNGDGNADMLLGHWLPVSGGYYLALGDGTGRFDVQDITWQHLNGAPAAMTVFDFDGDGTVEMAALFVKEEGYRDEQNQHRYRLKEARLELWRVDAGLGMVRETSTVLDSLIYLDDREPYSLQPGDFTGNGRAEILLTKRRPTAAFRHFFSFEADSMRLIRLDTTSSLDLLPFIASSSGDYVRFNKWRVRPSSNAPNHVVLERRVARSTVEPPEIPKGLRADVSQGGVILQADPVEARASGGTIYYQIGLHRNDGSFVYSSESLDRFEKTWDYALGGRTRPVWQFDLLEPGQYSARVRAVDASGQHSIFSDPAEFAISHPGKPGVPENIQISQGEGSLNISFSLLTPFDSLLVYRSLSDDVSATLLRATLLPGSGIFVDHDLDGGQVYFYWLLAYLDGAESDVSEEVSAQAPMLEVKAIQLTDDSFRILDIEHDDFDRDGYEDLVVLLRDRVSSEHQIRYVPGTAGGFVPEHARVLWTYSGAIHRLFVEDVDGDLRADIAFDGEEPHVLLMRGMEVQQAIPLSLGESPTTGVPNGLNGLVDLDLDGRADLLTGTAPRLFVGWNEGDGRFSFETVSERTDAPYDLRLIDFDQDGYCDIFLDDGVGAAPVIYRNEGNRTFSKTDVGFPSSADLGIYISVDPLWLNEDAYPDLTMMYMEQIDDSLGTYHHEMRHAFYTYDPTVSEYAPFSIPFADEVDPDLENAHLQPVHLDNDGYVDFVTITENNFIIWWNEANRRLRTEINSRNSASGLISLFNLDDDQDGDWDTFFAYSRGVELYRIENREVYDNAPPSVPQNVRAETHSEGMLITWSESEDDYSLPGHIGYGVRVISAADTLQIGRVYDTGASLLTNYWSSAIHLNQLMLPSAPNEPFVVRVAAVDQLGAFSGYSTGLSITDNEGSPALPTELELAAVFPNPFRQATTLRYSLPSTGPFRLVLYNLLGQVVKVIDEGTRLAGTHTDRLDASDLAPGVYFCRLETSSGSKTQKLVVL